jgi:hypothetical protein
LSVGLYPELKFENVTEHGIWLQWDLVCYGNKKIAENFWDLRYESKMGFTRMKDRSGECFGGFWAWMGGG